MHAGYSHSQSPPKPQILLKPLQGRGRTAPFGDGGPAISATLSHPHGVAVDGLGNLYIADTLNHRVRRVDASGTIATVAGTGAAGFGGDGGPATSAALRRPHGVAVDGVGNIYIADTWNDRVRRVDASGTIATIAGDSGTLSGPNGVAVDGVGNVYIVDTWNHQVRRVDASGTIATVAGTGVQGYSGDGGPAVSATLNFPHGVAVDGLGNLYVADSQNDRVRRIDAFGTITTIAGDSGTLSGPHGVAFDGVGNIYIVDTWNHQVRRVDASGTITTVAGSWWGFGGDGGPAESALFNSPRGLAVDTLGYLYIADTENDRIRRVRLNQGGTSGPSPADPYTPLDEWTVSDNRLQFTILATRHCFPINSLAIAGVIYTVHTSKWQRRASTGTAWEDVAGTSKTGQLCPYSPSRPGQYRAVAEITINGERGKYSRRAS